MIYYYILGILSTLFFVYYYRKDGTTTKKGELYWAVIGHIIFPVLWMKFFYDMYNKEDYKLLCKKDLYKSTYKSNAFIKDKKYKVIEEKDGFYCLIDEKGNEFVFSIKKKKPYYHISKYFEL